MPWDLIQLNLVLPAFVLVLFRVGGLMFTAPVFGSRVVPARIKMAISVTLAVMIFPVLGPRIEQTLTLGNMLAGMVGELMIGMILGFSITLMFVGVQLGGMLIGQQAGIGLAQAFNPVLEAQSSIISQIYFFLALMIFLAIDGHRALVSAILDSFVMIPVMTFTVDAAPVDMAMKLLQSAYGMALSLAGPALVALFLSGMSMGLISRTMPQLNILAVGFVLRVLVGLTATAFTISLMADPVADRMIQAFDTVRELLGLV